MLDKLIRNSDPNAGATQNGSFKITAVGDGMVGKTCMLITFAQKEFPSEYIPTVFDNYACQIETKNNKTIDVVLWDTAGQEDYERLRPLTYPNTDCFLLCYSINSSSSYKNVFLKWYKELQEYCPNVPIILVGTKSDLRGTPEAVVTKTMASKMRKRISASKSMECSALENTGLNEILSEAGKYAIKYRTNRNQPSFWKCFYWS